MSVKRRLNPRDKTYEGTMARDRVEAEGLVLPAAPEGTLPGLPDDVTSLSDQELMRQFRELTQWLDFLEVRLAETATDAESAEKHLRRVEALFLGTSDARNVTSAKADASVNQEVMAAQDDYDLKNATRRMMRVLYDNTTRDAGFLSREITRRVGREPLDRRNHKYGGA